MQQQSAGKAHRLSAKREFFGLAACLSHRTIRYGTTREETARGVRLAIVPRFQGIAMGRKRMPQGAGTLTGSPV
jgi:hypothetical protein